MTSSYLLSMSRLLSSRTDAKPECNWNYFIAQIKVTSMLFAKTWSQCASLALWLGILVVLAACERLPHEQNPPKSPYNTSTSRKPLPVKVPTETTILHLPTRSFAIPRNYQGIYPDGPRPEITLDQFGFVMFLPNFDGFDSDTAKYSGSPGAAFGRMIHVTTVREPVYEQMQEGKPVKLPASSWGDPEAVWKVTLPPGWVFSRTINGAECYSPPATAYNQGTIACRGKRSNGELLIFSGREVDASSPKSGSIEIRNFSPQAGLMVRYSYSGANVSQWREIDDAIWAKLEAWRLKK